MENVHSVNRKQYFYTGFPKMVKIEHECLRNFSLSIIDLIRDIDWYYLKLDKFS